MVIIAMAAMVETVILMAVTAIVRLMAMVETVKLMAMITSHQQEREGQSSPPFSSTLLLQFSSEIVTLNTLNAMQKLPVLTKA